MGAIRNDGYMNLLSGLNAPGLDRSVMGSFGVPGWRGNLQRYWATRNSYYEYGEIYLTNGLAQKIIDRPSDDAFQRGIKIEGDDSDVMQDEFDRLAIPAKFADAVRWSRLYGGAVILLIAKDGGEFTDPLNLDRLDEVSELRVYDATCLKNPGRYYDDKTNPDNYGKPEFYTLVPPGMMTFDVHETRLIPIAGEVMPVGHVNLSGINWIGRPVLEGCIADLMRYGQALEWALRLLERKQQAIYNMSGLGEMFANGDDLMVQKRINLVDLVRGNLNSVVVDKDDVYNILNLGLDGLQPLLDEYQTALCASSNIPKIVLFGDTQGGLNTSAQGNLESYYSMVSKIQQVIAKPALERLVSVLYVQSAIKKSDIPDDWEIQFNPLWMPSALEQAQTDQAEGMADQSNINNLINLMNDGILSAEEVRKVIVNDIYNEYDFDEALPSDGGDINYAEGVDTSMLVAPTGQEQKSNKTNGVTNVTITH